MAKLRALLVDDQLSLIKSRVEGLSREPFSARLEATASDESTAVAMVRTALEEGNPFDVIVTDYLLGERSGMTAYSLLAEIAEIYDRFPEAKLPTVILNSGLDNKVGLRHAKDIALQTRFTNTAFLPRIGADYEQYVSFLEAIHGNKPADDITITEEANTDYTTIETLLDAFETYRTAAHSDRRSVREVITARTAFSDALSRFPSDDMLRPFQDTVEAQTTHGASIEFSDSIGSSLSGRLAFTAEDIERLRAENAEQPIILTSANGDSATIGQFTNVEGVILIGSRASHFRQVAGGMGKTSLMMNSEVISSDIIRVEEERLVINNGATILKAGDIVTLDTNRNILLAGIHPITPATRSELYTDFAEYARDVVCEWAANSTNETPHQLAITNQIDFPGQDHGAPAPDDYDARGIDVGLSRVENYYLSPAGQKVLATAILKPTKKNLAALRDFTRDHVRELFGNGSNSVTFRMMDLKLDQIENPKLVTALETKLGKGIRGFQLAHVMPEIYIAQTAGILLEMSQTWDHGRRHTTLAIPHTETVEDIECARAIIMQAHRDREEIDHNWEMASSLAITIETRKGVENLERLAEHAADSHHGITSLHVLVGSTDLTEDLIGIKRNDDAAIKKWMTDNGRFASPFRSMSPALRQALQKIDGIRRQYEHSSMRVCGEHTTNFGFASLCRSNAIEVCVPNRPIYLQGWKNVMAVHDLQAMLGEDALPPMPRAKVTARRIGL